MAAIVEVTTEVLPDPANPMLLVHITDDTGVRGTGETWWGTYQPSAPLGAPVAPIKAMVDHVLGPACIGRPADDIEGVWQHLYRASYQYGPEGIVSSAIAGIDLALWDRAGRAAGRPVAALLGAVARTAVPAYASLTWYGAAAPAVADARRAVAAGFRAVKLHEGSPSVVLAVRDALGPEIAIMVDVSARFTEAAAVDFARAVEAAGILWVEEPVFPQQDHAALARVAAAIAQPLAAGENEFSVAGFERLAASGAVRVLQPDLVKCGGLTMAAAVAGVAARRGLGLAPHNFSLGPSLAANVAWAMVAPSVEWIEVPFLPAGQRFPGPWTPPVLVDGAVPYPADAGLSWVT